MAGLNCNRPRGSQAFERYEKLYDVHYDAVSAYYDAQSKWQEKMDGFGAGARDEVSTRSEEIPALLSNRKRRSCM